ncbi:hypothetical protein GCM10009119_10330 [Algoriphagus jejuensis]|uniref:DinB-like domain-containing protein n=1 Tax=Algoriphagus jejuensis TaxID=419934 RepID=A0ABP3Y9C1_9BACT
MKSTGFSFIKYAIKSQFGAAIDMLENAVRFCPGKLWETEKAFSHQAFHTLFFLDYYLSLNPVGFTPPAHFKYSEFGDEPPLEIFSRAEILEYLLFCRTKFDQLIADLNESLAERRWINGSKTMDFSMLEILRYNLRHVQHHVGQLNVLLRQKIDDSPKWVYRYGDQNKL